MIHRLPGEAAVRSLEARTTVSRVQAGRPRYREYGTWHSERRDNDDREPLEGRADPSGNVVSRLVLDVRSAKTGGWAATKVRQ
jgi:hypothetical protein